jgi:6-phosphogluconolactonase
MTNMNIKATLALAALGAIFTSALADDGLVFTESNAVTNQVLVYTHGGNGQLTFSAAYSTGGIGTSAGLGSQGAVTLSDNGEFLFAVDAGSNDVAVFKITGRTLRLVGRFASGGTTPISVTSSGHLLYTLNAGGNGNIAGFRIKGNGDLEPVTLSAAPLSSNASGPAEISFSPSGNELIVTEKATNTIDTWPVFGDRPGPLFTTSSNGQTPFGFDFDRWGHLFASEAAGGAPNGSSASSYALGQAGWNIVTGSAPTNQTAACWAIVSPDGRFGYTANAGSGSISGFSIARSGALSLITPSGQTGITGAGSHPVDMAFSRNAKFLYVLCNGNGTICQFRANNDGTLTSLGTASGIPASAQGLASR